MIGLYVRYGYGYGYYMDPTYILIIIAAVISLLAQLKVKSTFSKYSAQRSRSGMTGAQAAERLLNSQGIYDVTIQRVSGKLTDHYDPGNKTLNLSEGVYNNASVAAVGVAAHECGHAIQHAKGYLPLAIRSALVPIANFGSRVSWIFIILGIIFSFNQTMIYIGIFMFAAAVLFQLVTLPVEFNASSRALQLLKEQGILSTDEAGNTRKVLSAAAMTYVAAAATAVLQLLRLILLYGGRDRD
ncbi:MAG: zinc metallopeptidase [Eubacteriales bacterium]|nr:zinc metallopeptidase [Eubacteriales bacterium]